MAVGRRARQQFSGDDAAGARNVLDDEWAPEGIGQLDGEQPCQHVGVAARRGGGDEAHALRRIGLLRLGRAEREAQH